MSIFERVANWFNLNLVEGWNNWWKWASVRLAAFASAALAFLVAAPDVALGVLNQMPPELRAYLSPVIGMILFGLVLFTRLTTKTKPPEECNDDAKQP